MTLSRTASFPVFLDQILVGEGGSLATLVVGHWRAQGVCLLAEPAKPAKHAKQPSQLASNASVFFSFPSTLAAPPDHMPKCRV